MQTHTILKNKEGERFVQVGINIIPADIAGLGAGPDAWLRHIKCKCLDCGEPTELQYMTGNGRWCDTCAFASVEEELA